MRRNERLVGAHFSIGIEDAVFLRGELPLAAVTADELDRAIGTLYATVEQVFRGPPADRLRQPLPVDADTAPDAKVCRLPFRCRIASADAQGRCPGRSPIGDVGSLAATRTAAWYVAWDERWRRSTS